MTKRIKQWRLERLAQDDVQVFYDRKVRLRANSIEEAMGYVRRYIQHGENVIDVSMRDGYETDVTKDVFRARVSK